jgi:PAS domain-containing protein
MQPRLKLWKLPMKRRPAPSRKRASRRERFDPGAHSLRSSRHCAPQGQSAEVQRLRHLLDQSSELILAFNPSSLRVEVANDTACAWLGRGCDNLPGRSLAEIHPPSRECGARGCCESGMCHSSARRAPTRQRSSTDRRRVGKSLQHGWKTNGDARRAGCLRPDPRRRAVA